MHDPTSAPPSPPTADRPALVRSVGALRLGLALLLAGCVTASPRENPLTAAEHNDLGVAHFRAGDPSRAAREFERALALQPGWPRGLVNLGDARLAGGDVTGAIEAYERAVVHAPEDAAVANNLAWALLQDPQRWPEAEPVIRRALARHPEPRGYYLDTLGVALLRRGDAHGALDAFLTALAGGALQSPATRALVLEHAAEAYRRTGNATSAAVCLRLARREARAGPGETGVVGGAPSVC